MKRSKAYRIHHKERVIKNRKKLCSQIENVDSRNIEQPNRMDKRHPLDCGQANCSLCRYSKKEFTKKEKFKLPLEDTANE